MGAYAGYQGKKSINERDRATFSRQMVKILNYGGMTVSYTHLTLPTILLV